MVRGIPDRSIESWLTFFCRLVFRLMVERDRERSLRDHLEQGRAHEDLGLEHSAKG